MANRTWNYLLLYQEPGHQHCLANLHLSLSSALDPRPKIFYYDVYIIDNEISNPLEVSLVLADAIGLAQSL